jgi:predicted ATP-dependent endonuclease of OLD family
MWSTVNALVLDREVIESRRSFLDTILKEIEEIEQKKTDISPEVVAYKQAIEDAQAALFILSTKNKEGGNAGEFQKLVEDYNKKMKELKKKYEFLEANSKNDDFPQQIPGASSHQPPESTQDHLNWSRKSHHIKEGNFAPLEFEYIPNEVITTHGEDTVGNPIPQME